MCQGCRRGRTTKAGPYPTPHRSLASSWCSRPHLPRAPAASSAARAADACAAARDDLSPAPSASRLLTRPASARHSDLARSSSACAPRNTVAGSELAIHSRGAACRAVHEEVSGGCYSGPHSRLCPPHMLTCTQQSRKDLAAGVLRHAHAHGDCACLWHSGRGSCMPHPVRRRLPALQRRLCLQLCMGGAQPLELVLARCQLALHALQLLCSEGERAMNFMVPRARDGCWILSVPHPLQPGSQCA